MLTMTGAQIAWAEMTEEEKKQREEKRKQIAEKKALIKSLVEAQVAEKKFLRMPHDTIPEMITSLSLTGSYLRKEKGINAARILMSRTRERRWIITTNLIAYGDMRGKPHIKPV
jgi:hypothetical protein